MPSLPGRSDFDQLPDVAGNLHLRAYLQLDGRRQAVPGQLLIQLGTRIRTIDNHRAKIMNKMEAHELVRIVLEVHGAPTSPPTNTGS